MAQIIRVKPGVVTAQDGTYPELRGARKGGLVSQDVGGRYEEGSYRGAMFYAVNTAAQALSVASSTYTGLVLANPVGSPKNLVLLEVLFAPSIAETGVGAIVLGWGGVRRRLLECRWFSRQETLPGQKVYRLFSAAPIPPWRRSARLALLL